MEEGGIRASCGKRLGRRHQAGDPPLPDTHTSRGNEREDSMVGFQRETKGHREKNAGTCEVHQQLMDVNSP